MIMDFKIIIHVEGQDIFEQKGSVDNISKDLHEAVQKYVRDIYVKKEEIHEFDRLENHHCKNCGEGTISEMKILPDGVKWTCTKCGMTD